MKSCKLVPMKAQWNDVGIAVRIVKEGGHVPDNKACLMTVLIEKKGKLSGKAKVICQLIRVHGHFRLNSQAPIFLKITKNSIKLRLNLEGRRILLWEVKEILVEVEKIVNISL